MKQLNLPITHANGMPTKSGIKFLSENVFCIPQPMKYYFSEYYLLYWEGEYLLFHSNNKEGLLPSGINKKQMYEIRYKNPLTRGKILLDKHSQYALSFRTPKPCFNLPSIVIVSKGTGLI